jgi:RND family efflux transporter MFP subunit
MTSTSKANVTTERPLTDASRALVLASLFLAACGGGNQQGQGMQMPPSGVEVTTLKAAPIDETSEFAATLKSRTSSNIQPQVEGFVTKIAVRSGQRVSPGATLFEIDSAPQQAAVASQQSVRSAREAEVEYARQQAARTRKLFEAGAASQRDAEEADTGLKAAEAQLKSADEQVKQQRSQLGYYRVTAPSAGVVSDIPVRVGDRVTTSTLLTTIAENDRLEIYVNVPVTQASRLKVGLPVRIVDDSGAVVATNRISFVASAVDDATQTILAKAAVDDGRGDFRADQFVRARVVWASNPGLTAPVTAVQRIAGQFFAYVAESDGKGGFVAKQKAIEVGDIVGNDYIVKTGLKEGDQLIVAGLQKIGDGAPVSIAPAATAPAASPATDGKKGQ